MKTSKGLTLIELMLALTISMIILAVCSSVYCAVQKNLQSEIALAQLQENARVAQEFLQTDIQLAGYIGCAKLTADFPITPFQTYGLHPAISIAQHAITVRYANAKAALLTKDIHQGLTLHATLTPGFTEGTLLIISDCKHAEIFKAAAIFTTTTEQIITASAPLRSSFKRQADIAKLEMNTFTVAKTTRINQVGQPVYALYKTDIKKQKIELVEGVESMEVEQQLNDGVSIELSLSSAGLFKKWYSYIAVS